MLDHNLIPHYADRVWQGTVAVEENASLARDTYRVRIRCPELARAIVPGQFIMLRLPGASDPLLGRPLALYDVVRDAAGEPAGLDIVYLVVGKMTGQLCRLAAGAILEAWGPLGNGFAPAAADHLIMVAGGIGQTPFLALAREVLGQCHYGDPPRDAPRIAKVTLCYGARSADRLAGVEGFRRAGVDVALATDDGTAGHHGLVTDLIRPAVKATEGACRLVCCGPEPMLEAAARIAQELDVPAQVSLESPMACGIGICFSCVAKIRDASGKWDYRRTCVEGPVFDARDVEFH
ncbi:MAG: dihydroorotate dehydrogenase electron transfer subunit [Pirellulales bacterium]|nr:dihydroorotate dehydrogenase electron transfer subunit [Pirellulales bacterium]